MVAFVLLKLIIHVFHLYVLGKKCSKIKNKNDFNFLKKHQKSLVFSVILVILGDLAIYELFVMIL